MASSKVRCSAGGSEQAFATRGAPQPSGALNVKRRTWDKAEFEAKAKERAAAEEAGVAVEAGKWKTHFPDAPDGLERVPGSRRAYLSSGAQESLDLEKNLHKRFVVQATEEGATTTSAFASKKTGVTVQNSLAYLDHIHGKKYQRAQGMSMRVKASTLSEVKGRLKAMGEKRAREKAARKAGGGAGAVARAAKLEAFTEQVQAAQAAKRRRVGAEEGGGAELEGAPAAEARVEPAAAPVAVAVAAPVAEAGAEAAAAPVPAPTPAPSPAPAPEAEAEGGEEEDELAAMAAVMGMSGFGGRG